MLRTVAAVAAVLCLSWANVAAAQSEPQPEAPKLDWQVAPLLAPIGDELAEIDLPEGFLYLDQADTAKLMELTGNPVNGSELATVAPADDGGWFLIFEWSEIGWVDDSERDALDADALFASMKEGTEAANEARRERGWPTIELVGWQEAPHYDERTKNLTWAIEGRTEGEVVLNRLVKLLGRRGVMSVTLVGSPEELASARRGGPRVARARRAAGAAPRGPRARAAVAGALRRGARRHSLRADAWLRVGARRALAAVGVRRDG
jgi:uncharacterized membrane-anchored protein